MPEDNAVKIEPGTGLVHCHRCGKRVKAEYKEQDPAPCGCAWVWSERTGQLEACSSNADDPLAF
jgi:hypothetical protein